MKRNLAVVSAVHSEFDRVWSSQLDRTSEQYGPPTCTRGCSACCYEPAYVEIQEVQLALSALSPEDIARVTQATAEWHAKASAAGVLDLAEPPVVMYRSLRLACPLLKDGECMVYENRPIACRAHFAIGPRDRCDIDAKRLTQRFVNPLGLTAQAMAAFVSIRGVSEMNHLGALLAKLLLGKPTGSAGVTMRLTTKKPAAAAPGPNIIDVNSAPVD